jgi:hypothetical protein
MEQCIAWEIDLQVKFFLRKITHRRMKKIDFVDYTCYIQINLKCYVDV